MIDEAILLPTLTVTGAEVAVFPARSRAIAVRLWVPFAAVFVSQELVYGTVVSAAPRLWLSNWNWMLAMPTLSEATAEIVIAPETVAPSPGVLMKTIGGVVSGGKSKVMM